MERTHREDYLQAAMVTPLFRGLPAAFVKDAAARGYAECFAAGTPVFLSGDAKRRLGVLVSGKAEVYKPAGTGRVLMSVLTPGALLGAASLFLADAHAVTEVDALTPCEVLFFDEETLKTLMQENFALAENYFCYLTERIHFLTGRIESIASPTVADKLLNYLAQNAENGAVGIPHGYNRLASTLSVSRASLYRVMDELEREGRIAREGKRILIKEVNHKEMEGREQ